MNGLFATFLALIIVTSLFVTCLEALCNVTAEGSENCKKPFYNVAHMVNTIPEVTYYLDKGANAIECDVNFHMDGTARWVHHGSICDCGRRCDGKEDISVFLDFIRNITTPGSPSFRPELVFVFLDLKLDSLDPRVKSWAGEHFANLLIEHLWIPGVNQSQVYVLLSVQTVSDKDFVTSCKENLKTNLSESFHNRYGWDVGMDLEIDNIITMWKEGGIYNHLWLGDGITNCFNAFTHFLPETRLKRVLREQKNCTWGLAKVYKWTIDDPELIKRNLRSGMDAILTNKPEVIREILLDPEFRATTRLATIQDSPWVTSRCNHRLQDSK